MTQGFLDFGESKKNNGPLAFKQRPSSFENYFGQEHIFKRYSFLKTKSLFSLIIWGPPGSGKTTLAHILAKNSNMELYPFNAVLGGINDLKKIIKSALELKEQFSQMPIIFIDEIHRFNKSQQDALLPYVEKGEFVLIGATTENPRTSVNRALLSRLKVIELKKLNEKDLDQILKRACLEHEIKIDENSINYMAMYSNGDARVALNTLELVINESKAREKELNAEEVKKVILENAREYDKNDNRHYDVISAFIKSMRGTDPDAATLWLAVMLDGGEDPMFIARRLVIFASEDVGNADPTALQIAVNAMTAIEKIGMPEARIILSQATNYLASTLKSNASYQAINEALAFVKSNSTIEVPTHLQNLHPDKKKYLYPHNFSGNFINQDYTVNPIPKFYRPSIYGREKQLKDRLSALKSNSKM